MSPCDGTLSVASALQADQLLQAKGHAFSLEALLGDAAPWAAALRGGLYATLYLAPFNYHRVHMPLGGRLSAAWHIAGRLFSVNSATVARVPGLFARNERIVLRFEGEHGPFVVVLVGALFVGSMSTVWHGEITPWRGAPGRVRSPAPGFTGSSRAPAADLWQPRGAELGRFNMGSTVLLLLPPGLARWDAPLHAASCRRRRPAARLAAAPARLMNWRPTASLPTLRLRAELLAAVRGFSPTAACWKWTRRRWFGTRSPTGTSTRRRSSCRATARRCSCTPLRNMR